MEDLQIGDCAKVTLREDNQYDRMHWHYNEIMRMTTRGVVFKRDGDGQKETFIPWTNIAKIKTYGPMEEYMKEVKEQQKQYAVYEKDRKKKRKTRLTKIITAAFAAAAIGVAIAFLSGE